MGISTAGHKTICVPAPSAADYQKLIQKGSTFRSYLDPLIESYPELFPPEITNGYWLHDILRSKKLNLTTRRIQMVTSKSVYQVRPDFALPYMVGKTDDVEKGLYLRRFGVPFDALAYVFGRDDSYWYRLYQSIGRLSIVGTTIKDPEAIPVNLVADEKHSWRLGERVFIPTTVGAECLLGADIVHRAETPDLVNAENSARLHVRAMALVWNFYPYGSRTTATDPNRCSPFKDLNGFEYHDNWLRNLLIAGSMNGYRQ